LFLGFIAITIVTLIGYYLFRHHLKEPAKVSGMLIALYTGGTPNLAAMKTALNVDNNLFVIINSYDLLAGMVYFSFIITIAQVFFNLFMKPYKSVITALHEGSKQENSEMEYKNDIWQRSYIKPIIISSGISILFVAMAVSIGYMVSPVFKMAVIILILTSLGIGASLFSFVRSLKKSFSLGMYLILVFCLALGTMADIHSFTLESVYILYFILLVIFGTLILHALLSWLFNIDTDTFIMVSVGLIFSPPFVPAVAVALRNKEVILAGIVSGLLSYAAGNYMGIAIAYFLK